MINAGKLLADLKRLRKVLDADLRATHTAGAQRDAVQAEWREAFDLGRTRDTFEAFLDGAFDQAVVHWVLGCVFLRFLEDNLLVDRPFLSGPGERLDLAKERQEAHFRARPHDSDTEYLIATFDEAARLPGMAGLFDPEHNPLFRLPLSGDGAMALIRFFREVLPETGELAHDFTDPDWNTRFLGDLYQDLSEEARKRYALLQTPDFVESWILDRTLEPAIREFGHEHVTMIDPACGSGHFLLGGFARVLREWQRFAPGLPPAEQAQRALDAIAGVDLNPFAVEIARFRLLVAALRAADALRLSAAPSFRMHLATGDSLLHGRHFSRRELGGAQEGFGRVLRHHYAAEDNAEISSILGRQYHAVVGNPPYITPKDPAMRDAYREIYASCHGKYGLGAPFIERFFDLTLGGDAEKRAGHTGLIVADTFMRREFGKRLIEEVLPRFDLTHIVDVSRAQIQGSGVTTVILFGRNRSPVQSTIRVVTGLQGDPPGSDNPGLGPVWTAIVRQIDIADSKTAFVAVEDAPRPNLAKHPWSIGLAGGSSDVMQRLNEAVNTLGNIVGVRLARIQVGDRTITKRTQEMGFASFPGVDDVFFSNRNSLLRFGVPNHLVKQVVIGEVVRDWHVTLSEAALAPYDDEFELVPLNPLHGATAYMWPFRTTLGATMSFGNTTKAESGGPWWSWYRWIGDRYKIPCTITYAFVATHNHFVLDRGGNVFNRSAPVIKLPQGASEGSHLSLVGLLNSSTACFWMKGVFHNKGATVDDQGARQRTDPFENFYEFTSTGLARFPLPSGTLSQLENELHIAFDIDRSAQQFARSLPTAICCRTPPTRDTLDAGRLEADAARGQMVGLQEELDWKCYRLYGLIDEALEHENPPGLRVGERAFEIVMARRVATGELETAWFDRHGTTAITDLPSHWPDDYRRVVEHRIALIETDATVDLIERPEFKRRWTIDSWEEMEQTALRNWLLDRMELPTLWVAGDARLLSTNQLSDLLRRDADFLSVAALYAGRPDVNLEALVADLVAKESVPFLAVLRYAETGLRKRAQWEATWEKQRREDAIDAEVAARHDPFRAQAERRAQEQWQTVNPRRSGEEPEPYAIRMLASAAPAVEQRIYRLVAEEQSRRKREEVGDIPVPPKYVTKDFQSTDFWRLRGGLDVPKERFVSFPHCQRDADGSLVVTWAGHNHLKRALAIAAYYQERKDGDGWPAERLVF